MYAWLIEMDNNEKRIALSIDNVNDFIKSSLSKRNLEKAFEMNRFNDNKIIDTKIRIHGSNDYIHITRIDMV